MGTFILWLIWRLIKRDWDIKDQNLDILDKIHIPRGIRMTKEACTIWSKGRFLIPFIFFFIIGLNLVFIFLHILLFLDIYNMFQYII